MIEICRSPLKSIPFDESIEEFRTRVKTSIKIYHEFIIKAKIADEIVDKMYEDEMSGIEFPSNANNKENFAPVTVNGRILNIPIMWELQIMKEELVNNVMIGESAWRL